MNKAGAETSLQGNLLPQVEPAAEISDIDSLEGSNTWGDISPRRNYLMQVKFRVVLLRVVDKGKKLHRGNFRDSQQSYTCTGPGWSSSHTRGKPGSPVIYGTQGTQPHPSGEPWGS